jgi:ABC-type multidrug transport system fused ATPase/permease subunit
MNPLSDILNFLKIFQAQLGRRIYLVFLLSLVAALAESFGIVMVLPLLQSLVDVQGGGAQPSIATAGRPLYSNFGGDPVVWLLLAIATAFVLKGAMLFSAQGLIEYLRAELLRELKDRLFGAFSRMRYGYYTSRDTGHFINVINGQVNQMLTAFQQLSQLGSHVVTAIIFVAVALLVAWRFGMMALVMGIAIVATFRRLNQIVRRLSRASAFETGRLAKLLVQFLHAFKFLTATNQSARLGDHVRNSVALIARYEMKRGIATAFTNAAREPAAVVIIIGIVMVQLVLLDQPLGPIMVSIMLFHRAFQSLTQIQVSWQGTLNHIGSVEMVRDELRAQAEHQEPDGVVEVPPLTLAIELRHVSFRYAPDLPDVLSDVTLTIPARTSVALVGESGAGKSTLADILTLMLRPHQGRVLIDGVSAGDIKLATWRRQIGYVSQDTVVFDDSIANNICMWSGDFVKDPALAERIRVAARKAHIAHFIDTLPQGYETLVGDRGVRLSGGQRQRLFIARELFREPNLLILDEATSSLDTESERAVQRSIDELRGQITVVMVAHRLSTIRQVDQVFVFDKGRLVELGSYDELKSREKSTFGRLVAMQAL